MRFRVGGGVHRDMESEKEERTRRTENVTPNNNVIVNPYRKTPEPGRVSSATAVRNPYKKTDFTNAACLLREMGPNVMV